MKKLLSVIALVSCFALLFSLTACTKIVKTEAAASSESDSAVYTGIDMSVACLKGPTGVGMAKLMADKDAGLTANNYTFTVASSADEISGKIVSGEINIAAVPTNLAAKLYNKTGGKITMLAVNTLGVLSVIENGNTVQNVKDLKGKTIYATGEGSNPEYILRFVLSENDIDPDKDVTLKFVATNDELTSAIISGKATVAMIAEPAASVVLTKKDTLRVALSMNDEWSKVSESKLMMGCIIALSSYVDEHKQQVNKFIAEYGESVGFATEDIMTTADYCEKYSIIPTAEIAKNAIHGCNLTYVLGTDMKVGIEGYLGVLMSADPTSIGGEMPGDDFYYNAGK